MTNSNTKSDTMVKETKGSSTVITPDNKIVVMSDADFLQKYGLDFKVGKKPYSYFFNGKSHKSSNSAIIRLDSGVELGNCKDRYTIRQNEEIFKTLKKICAGTDFVFEKGGVMGNGEKVYFFIQNPESLKLGNDTVKRYIFAISSHDGSGNLAFGYSSTVMSCFNQFNRFYKSSSLKIKHTASSKRKLDAVPDIFRKFLTMQEITDNAFKKMAEVKDNKVVNKLARELVDYLMKTDKVADVNNISTRKMNIITDLKNSINHEIRAKGHNLWGLFNGVTYFVNHKKAMRKEPTAKMQSIFDVHGTGYEMQNKAFEWICEKINVDF